MDIKRVEFIRIASVNENLVYYYQHPHTTTAAFFEIQTQIISKLTHTIWLHLTINELAIRVPTIQYDNCSILLRTVVYNDYIFLTLDACYLAVSAIECLNCSGTHRKQPFSCSESQHYSLSTRNCITSLTNPF